MSFSRTSGKKKGGENTCTGRENVSHANRIEKGGEKRGYVATNRPLDICGMGEGESEERWSSEGREDYSTEKR